MIHGRAWKNAPPSEPFGPTTTVNTAAPKGTTSFACRPLIGSRFSLVTSTSLVRFERPR